MKTHTPHQKKPLASAVAGALDFAGFDDWFEVFRAGEQTDSKGRTQFFTEADLDSIVANHNADDPAPLVVGHPKNNDPAYGWTTDLKRDGDTLFAKAGDVATEFESAVQAKHYRKRSVSIVPDTAGGYRLRHIGFLGGAAPAVSGLKDIDFADGDSDLSFEFSVQDAVQRSAWGLGSVGRSLRGIRDWIIAKNGLEEADQVIPDYQIESIQQDAAAMREELDDDRSFSSSDDSQESEHMPKDFSQEDMDNATAQERQRANDAEKRLKDFEFKARESDAKNLVDGLIADGKLLPAQTAGLCEFMAHLSCEADASFEFSAGDEAQQKTPYEFMREFMGSLGKQVSLGTDDRESADEHAQSYSAPAGYTVDDERAKLHAAAEEYAAKHGVTYAQAAAKLEQEQ